MVQDTLILTMADQWELGSCVWSIERCYFE